MPEYFFFKGFTSIITLLRKNLANVSGGFTFIELLIVISTMSLLFTLGFSNYRGYQQRQRIISAARLFRSDLRYAQEQALAGIKPIGCNMLNGYQVTYPGTNESTYEISANCDSSTLTVIKTVDIANTNPNIKFSAAFPMVFFNVLGRGVKMAGASLAVTLVDTNSTPNPTISIVITKGGEIN